jgi:type IV pilus assembly protein PilV
MNDRMRPTLTGCQGFTLLEAMVSGAILIVGVLTLTGMQAASLTRNVDSSELTLATNLAADMIDRVHFTGDKNNSSITALYGGIMTSNATTCNVITQQEIKGDCTQWQALLNNSGLLGVQGVVTVAPFGTLQANLPPGANQASLVTVQVNWTGYRNIKNAVSRVKAVALTTVVDPR